MPTPEYHADRSPSSAKQWLNCTPSLRLGDSFPKKTSEYAEAGRLAHAIAELKAQKRYMKLSKRSYDSQLKKLQENSYYAPEMAGYTDIYIEALDQHAMTFKSMPFTALETSVPIGVFTHETKDDGSPATGTADCIQIGEGVLWVTDYKNGAGVPVSAEDNPQMKIYALGALMLYSPIYGDTIQTIRMTIVQPALNSVSDWEIPRGELEAWALEVLSPRAAMAAAGEGDINPGEWCQFCPVRYTCRARANSALALEEFKKSLPPVLSDAEVGDALTRGAELVSWYKALEEYALQACLDGKLIPGYKAVEGRSSRAWADTDKAITQLVADGIDEALLYERKPITAPAAEKLLGKQAYRELAEPLVVKQPGKPTLAPTSDKRPPYNAALIAFGGAADG
ncbi:MAG: DUF2800 domain-containing protein [Oscillospiraceae bacterium]|nr:DUF2800 domain-containing protein [Oscillospiraceae bacterium]